MTIGKACPVQPRGLACGWGWRVVLYSADDMAQSEEFSRRIAARLHDMGLGAIAAAVLDAAGPLTLVAAQLAWVAEPLFAGSRAPLGNLARLFEDPDQVSDLVRQLRREEAQ